LINFYFEHKGHKGFPYYSMFLSSQSRFA